VRMSVTTQSATSADDVSVEIQVPLQSGLAVVDERALPRPPIYEGFRTMTDVLAEQNAPPPDITVSQLQDHLVVTARFGRIRPQERMITTSRLWVGVLEPYERESEAVIYLHDAAPTRVPIQFSLEVEERPMTMMDLRRFRDPDARE
jgi:hypothetical protein